MNYSFSDYSSIFKNPSFGTSSGINAFEGGPSSFLGGAKSSSGGSSSMLGPALGFAGSLGSSLIGGLFGNQQAADQMRMQNAIANQQIIEGRNLGYGQLASNIGGRTFGATVAPDLELRRQATAKREEMGPLAELAFARGSEASKRDRLARISRETQQAQRFENLLNMKRRGFELTAPMEAIFGPTAFSRRFTNV